MCYFLNSKLNMKLLFWLRTGHTAFNLKMLIYDDSFWAYSEYTDMSSFTVAVNGTFYFSCKTTCEAAFNAENLHNSLNYENLIPQKSIISGPYEFVINIKL